MSKKKIVFLAVTNSEDSNDRIYSDYVLEQCKLALSNEVDISSEYDVEGFKRHDMKNYSSLEKGIISMIQEASFYVILIDCFDGSYNPNVWFELGIVAITSKKPMILIANYAKHAKHAQYPFYIRNYVNVLLFPDVAIVKDESRGKSVVSDKDISFEQMKKFKNSFVEQFKQSTVSPFGMFADNFHLKLI